MDNSFLNRVSGKRIYLSTNILTTDPFEDIHVQHFQIAEHGHLMSIAGHLMVKQAFAQFG